MMERSLRWWLLSGLSAGLLATGGYAVYRLGLGHKPQPAPASGLTAGSQAAALKPGDIDPQTGKRVLYWHDPMVPGQRFEQPGKSPFMDMQLVPVYAEADGSGPAISSRTQQNLGIRTAEVRLEPLALRVEAAGNIAFNENDQVVITARATAFVEQLHVRALLDPVRAGQALAEIHVPDWIALQEEYLALTRVRSTGLEGLVSAARQRLRQAGMSEAQIEEFVQQETVQTRTALRAPIDGVLVEITAREGMTMLPGTTLFRINGLSTVWVNAEVPEGQAWLLRPGMLAEARASALPGESFLGELQALLPDVDSATRTRRARVELANPEGRLAPGMFVTVAFAAEPIERLTVPSEAVIRTGRRTLVMLAGDDNTFQAAEVVTGIDANGLTEILDGLTAGQRVVASGQFLIDSEASLRGVEHRVSPEPLQVDGEQP